jgi:GNAT superfamily N-acetyltransferase
MIKLKEINDGNIQLALDIYNSNKDFLIHHLGIDGIDKVFMENEIKEMKEHGFSSNLVFCNDRVVGLIDYGIQDSGYVYLSLLMLDKTDQKKGIGSQIYKYFEEKMMADGGKIIRIDVVDDYSPNVIPFWEQMGFVGQKRDSLTWGDKTSSVQVMTKNIKAE